MRYAVWWVSTARIHTVSSGPLRARARSRSTAHSSSAAAWCGRSRATLLLMMRSFLTTRHL